MAEKDKSPKKSTSLGITIRVGKGQGEKLAQEALAAGYGSVSAWLREACLGLPPVKSGDVIRVQLPPGTDIGEASSKLKAFLADGRKRKPKTRSKEEKKPIKEEKPTQKSVNLRHWNILNNANQFVKHLHQQSHRNLITKRDLELACLCLAEIRDIIKGK